MNSDDLLTHIMAIKEGQAKLATKMEVLSAAVMGAEQPGLVQKVEALEAAKNWTWGVGSVVMFLMGVVEWLVHRHPK